MKTVLKDFTFKDVTKVDMVWGNCEIPYGLLELAREKGFYNGNTAANKLFNKWFFSGLDFLPELKEGVDNKVAQRAMKWAACFMRSFEPKHEEKEAVCALIFDECLDLTQYIL